jgi:outer membrane protein assembly factor BamD
MYLHNILLTVILVAILGCSSGNKNPDKPHELKPRTAEGQELPETIDNSEMSSSALPTLTKAKEYYERGLYTLAREQFEIIRGTADSPFKAYAHLKIADSFFYAQQFPESISEFEAFIDQYPYHESTSYALYRVASANELMSSGLDRDPTPYETALIKYKEFIKKFPESPYSPVALIHIKKIQRELGKHHMSVSKFYAKKENLKAARARLNQAKISQKTKIVDLKNQQHKVTIEPFKQ